MTTDNEKPLPDEQLAAKEELARWLEEKGVSITEFAKKTGYPYTWAWALLRGNAPLSDVFIGRLVGAYGGDIAIKISQTLNSEATPNA